MFLFYCLIIHFENINADSCIIIFLKELPLYLFYQKSTACNDGYLQQFWENHLDIQFFCNLTKDPKNLCAAHFNDTNCYLGQYNFRMHNIYFVTCLEPDVCISNYNYILLSKGNKALINNFVTCKKLLTLNAFMTHKTHTKVPKSNSVTKAFKT